jgi:predicted phosphodiesterase
VTDRKNQSTIAQEGTVLVLSDLHIGNPASYLTEPGELRDLIAQAEPDTVVFNGDTVEMRHEPDMLRGERVARQARELCRDLGAEAVLVTGNHDPAISTNHWMELAGGRVLVTHGDILFPTIVPWSREASTAWEMHLRKLGEIAGNRPFESLSLPERFHAMRQACLDYESVKASGQASALGKLRMILNECLPPTRPLFILKVWMQTPRLAREFAGENFPRARIVVLGHTHRAGIWEKHGRAVINTGSYTPLSGRQAVIIKGQTLSLHQVRYREQKTGSKKWYLGETTYSRPLP